MLQTQKVAKKLPSTRILSDKDGGHMPSADV